jgi:hypothetical protein
MLVVMGDVGVMRMTLVIDDHCGGEGDDDEDDAHSDPVAMIDCGAAYRLSLPGLTLKKWLFLMRWGWCMSSVQSVSAHRIAYSASSKAAVGKRSVIRVMITMVFHDRGQVPSAKHSMMMIMMMRMMMVVAVSHSSIRCSDVDALVARSGTRRKSIGTRGIWGLAGPASPSTSSRRTSCRNENISSGRLDGGGGGHDDDDDDDDDDGDDDDTR